jgi:hypothetical protein
MVRLSVLEMDWLTAPIGPMSRKSLLIFLKDKERVIKEALLDGSFATARHLVNGGKHELPEFIEAYQIGETCLA